MASDELKNLWGQEFRVVAEGLAETDVVIFVEKMMREHREKNDQLEHIEALHRLAQKTVEDAEQLANGVRAEAKATSEAEASRVLDQADGRAQDIIEEASKIVPEAKAKAEKIIEDAASRVPDAERKAQEIIDEAKETAKSIIEKAEANVADLDAELLSDAQARLDGIKGALEVLKDAAVEELSGRMTTHYIGKHLTQSVHFIPAFEALIRRIEAELVRESYKPSEPEPALEGDENDPSMTDLETDSESPSTRENPPEDPPSDDS